jgi:hypothetical protein
MADVLGKVNYFIEVASEIQLYALFEEEIRFLAYSGVIYLSEKVE